jgi:hypothetical protein
MYQNEINSMVKSKKLICHFDTLYFHVNILPENFKTIFKKESHPEFNPTRIKNIIERIPTINRIFLLKRLLATPVCSTLNHLLWFG